MLTCRHDIDKFTWGCIVLSLPKRAHVDWNWPISREKISKNRLVCNNAVALAYYGSCRLQVMGSWKSLLNECIFEMPFFGSYALYLCHDLWFPRRKNSYTRLQLLWCWWGCTCPFMTFSWFRIAPILYGRLLWDTVWRIHRHNAIGCS